MRPFVISAFIFIGLFLPGLAYSSSPNDSTPAGSAPDQGASNTCTSSDCQAGVTSEINPSRAVFLGHNASPSSYALSAGQVTVGNFGIATGITDQLTIATSPWLWASYEAANVHLKWIKKRRSGTRIGALVSYFETFGDRPFLKCVGDWEGTWYCPNQPADVVEERRYSNPGNYKYTEAIAALPNRYQFQTVATHFLYGIDSGRQSYHFNFKFSYFFNDDRAYSIRVDPGANEIRGQVDATVLVEHRASQKLRFNFETGFLGLNAVVPSGHLGLSTSWMSEFWLVQFGASMTWRLPDTGPKMFEYLGGSDTGFHTAKDGQFFYGGRYHQSSVHPELQLQYFF
jgi:hypothetical protein